MLTLPWKSAVMFTLVMMACFTAVVSSTWADEEGAPVSGDVAPMRNLLAVVQKTQPGHILEVELEQEDYGEGNIWVYEVKLLTQKGRVYELEYDAVTLKLLNIEGDDHGR